MKVLDFLQSFAKVVALAACLTQAANANPKHEITMPEASIAVLEFGNDGKLVFTERQKRNFWQKVNRNGPIPDACPERGQCWIWMGSLNQSGYGNFGFLGRTRLSHRLSYFTHIGDVPPEKPFLLHYCHTPACVNPRHLHFGTQKENLREMAEAGRWNINNRPIGLNIPKGENQWKSRLSEADILAIRRRHLAGESQASIAREMRTVQSNVSRIVSGHYWSHVPLPMGPRKRGFCA